MKLKKTIQCYNIEGVPHLLPFGQGITEHVKGLATNEVGQMLWTMLSQGSSRDELLGSMMQYFEATAEDLPLLEADLDAFLASLSQHGFFEDKWQEAAPNEAAKRVSIGPLRIDLSIPTPVYETYFVPFAAKSCDAPDAKPDQVVRFCDHRTPCHPIGTVLVRNDEVLIMESEELYVILPLQGKYVKEIHCTKDGANATLYGRYDASAACLEEIFSAIRFGFLILAQEKGLSVMHSASLLYQGRAWLFSGPSGTGKSTHVRLWQEQFGTPCLNGDLNLLGCKNGQAICYGLPWCGTSGISAPGEYPLGGITFLKQAPVDRVQALSKEQFILAAARRMITPNWTASLLQISLDQAKALSRSVPGFLLECTKHPSAAETMKHAIDAVCEGQVPN